MAKKYKRINTLSSGAKKCPLQTIAQILLTVFKETCGPVLVAVGGPGGSGKSIFCKTLLRELPDANVLTLDDYKTPREERKNKKIYGAHPEANHIDLIVTHLLALRKGNRIDKPVYANECGEAKSTIPFSPTRFIILDGEISTYRQFKDYVDFSIFIDSDWKTQLATRLNRDIKDRGYSRKKAISVFLNSNLKEFKVYGAESKSWADIHMFCQSDYSLKIEAISEEVFTQCEKIFEADFK